MKYELRSVTESNDLSVSPINGYVQFTPTTWKL